MLVSKRFKGRSATIQQHSQKLVNQKTLYLEKNKRQKVSSFDCNAFGILNLLLFFINEIKKTETSTVDLEELATKIRYMYNI